MTTYVPITVTSLEKGEHFLIWPTPVPTRRKESEKLRRPKFRFVLRPRIDNESLYFLSRTAKAINAIMTWRRNSSSRLFTFLTHKPELHPHFDDANCPLSSYKVRSPYIDSSDKERYFGCEYLLQFWFSTWNVLMLLNMTFITRMKSFRRSMVI